jgi:hypothetical protein
MADPQRSAKPGCFYQFKPDAHGLIPLFSFFRRSRYVNNQNS